MALYDLMFSGMAGPVGSAIQSVQMLDVLQEIVNMWRKDPQPKATVEKLQPMLSRLIRASKQGESTDNELEAMKEFFSG